MSAFTPGGAPPRQPDWNSIVRGVQGQIKGLERILPQNYANDPPSLSWTIEHGRGRTVAVQVFDGSGNLIPPSVAAIQCVDPNTVVISSSTLIAEAVVI